MVLEKLSAAGLSPDGPAFWLLLAALLLAGIAFGIAHRRRRAAETFRAGLEAARIALAAAEARHGELDGLKDELEFARTERASLEASVAAARATLAERERALADIKTRMDTEFKAATAELLKGAHENFLQRANETFAHHREVAGNEAEKRREALDALIKPMSETLGRYETGLAEMRAEQHKARGELVGRMGDLAKSANDVRAEAQKLSTALRSGSKTVGRWGEEKLRRVVEIAGMTPYVDFVEQQGHDDGERRKQPDMVVNLPGGRKIAIDSKVSVGAFLAAVEAETDAERAAHIARHADDLWNHVKTLSAKDYAASLKDALDIVVMFVPGENYVTAAAETRPHLFDEAFDRKILIATPTTLVAMLKAASFNWRQEKAAENAVAVARMAKDLYESLRVLGGHLSGLGKALEGAVGRYNQAVGAIEQRVMPRARKFAEYELPGVEAPIDVIAEVETPVRRLRDDRDLLLPKDETDDPAA